VVVAEGVCLTQVAPLRVLVVAMMAKLVAAVAEEVVAGADRNRPQAQVVWAFVEQVLQVVDEMVAQEPAQVLQVAVAVQVMAVTVDLTALTMVEVVEVVAILVVEVVEVTLGAMLEVVAVEQLI
jgi:hypothetical protein